MSNRSLSSLTQSLAKAMGENSQRSSSLHSLFLTQRKDGLAEMKRLIERQMTGGSEVETERPALFHTDQLDEFGTGKISACFGPTFARYDSMPIPRIPNGDLKMMTRVTAISGSLRNLAVPPAIEVEYDASPDAWYFQEDSSHQLAYSLLMEAVLQPCGFLSAYLNTYELVPPGEYFFRNLDGWASVIDENFAMLDLRGKTITTRARLVSSVVSGSTAIQKFDFIVGLIDRSSQDFRHILYRGESTFGIFSKQTMANQVGLDSGQQAAAWFHTQPAAIFDSVNLEDFRTAQKAGIKLPEGRLAFLNQVKCSPTGGRYGQGYAYASRPVNPADWFYPFHFFGDPVMPGSLGVESILELLKGFAVNQGMDVGMRSPRFVLASGGPTTSWRYRGQITPNHHMVEIDVHVKKIDRHVQNVTLIGDANVWVDGMRIYEIKEAAVRILGEQGF